MDICRICLTSKTYRDLSELKFSADGNHKSGLEVLQFCLDIQPISNSPKMCSKCYKKLLSFFKFKIQAHKNHSEYEANHRATLFESYDQDSHMKKEYDLEIQEPCGNIDILATCTSDIEIKIEETYEQNKLEIDEAGFNSDNDSMNIYMNNNLQNLAIEESKENEPFKKKRGRPKKENILNKPALKGPQICEQCGKVVKNLKNHLISHLAPTEKTLIACCLCPKTFTTYGARYKHVKIKHLGIKKRCEICNKEIINLHKHMLLKHRTEELKHVCLVCKRRFYCHTNLKEHMRSHTNTRPYECPLCGKTFRIKLSLTTHIQCVHDKEKTHLCQFCSKGFCRKQALKIHLRTHTKEKPYPCETCGKAFSTPGQKKNHEMIHTGVKRYPCSHCDMSFYTRHALNTHMVSHTKERRHQCQYCGLKFGRSDHKKRHEKTAHEKLNAT